MVSGSSTFACCVNTWCLGRATKSKAGLAVALWRGGQGKVTAQPQSLCCLHALAW